MCISSDKPGHGKCSVHPLFQLSGSQSLPHEPELECIRLPAALDRLVSRVVADIIELILLEEVGGLGRVAALEEMLMKHSDEVYAAYSTFISLILITFFVYFNIEEHLYPKQCAYMKQDSPQSTPPKKSSMVPQVYIATTK